MSASDRMPHPGRTSAERRALDPIGTACRAELRWIDATYPLEATV